MLRQRGPGGDIFPFTSAAAVDLAPNGDALSGLAAFRPLLGMPVSVNGEAELAMAQLVSGNYHAVLGVQAVLGRTLTEQDREPVAVISHGYWQRRFAGDSNVVGRTFEMQGRSFTIVGVTPPEFFGTQPGRHVDVTAPLAAQTMKMPPNARWLYLIGRLAPGVSREQARAALRVRWAQLAAAQSSPSRPPVTLELDSGAQGLNELRRQFSLPLQILMAAVAVVLLVACANLAGLLIVRSRARQQEIAVRLSLGAARGRIVRQLLTESALLAAAGGAAGVALAYWVTDLLLAMMSRGRGPIVLDVAPNARTLVFTAVVTIVTAVLFGLLPALGASRTDVQRRLKLERIWRRCHGEGLGAGDGGRAGRAARPPAHVGGALCADFAEAALRRRRFPPGPRARRERVDRPCVSRSQPACALRGALCAVWRVARRAVGQHDHGHAARRRAVDGRGALPYPAVQRIPKTRRRSTTTLSARASSRRWGYRCWRGAISSSVMTSVRQGASSSAKASHDATSQATIHSGGRYSSRGVPASIVGVVKDVRYSSLRAAAPLMIYRPYRQEASAPADAFLLRTSSATAAALRPFVQAEVRAAAPALPPPSVGNLEDRVAAVLVEERMLAALSSAIGVLAAILAAIGIYSTVASAVARRQREIGIRMALGAVPGQVARMVVSEAFGIVAGGLAIGIPAAIAAALAARGVLAGVLFELSPTDPLILSSSAVAILLIASLAAYVPARRASRIDPVAAVKYE